MGDYYRAPLFNKDVLDTLRAYVDVHDEFLQQLYDEALLEEAELDKLQVREAWRHRAAGLKVHSDYRGFHKSFPGPVRRAKTTIWVI